VKEVAEETGIECVPEQLLAVVDGQRMGFSRFYMYMLLFHCTATGGELARRPPEVGAAKPLIELGRTERSGVRPKPRYVAVGGFGGR
ncbi:MAG: putative hydrolase, partial [Desertimonas sp.]|nr:putative hydrolase [Desertimonas sp.]